MSGSQKIESVKNEIILAFREETEYLIHATKDFIQTKDLKAVNSSALNSQLENCFDTIISNTSRQISESLEHFKLNQLDFLPATPVNVNSEVAELVQKISDEKKKKHRLEEELVAGMQALKELLNYQKILRNCRNSSSESEIQKRLSAGSE